MLRVPTTKVVMWSGGPDSTICLTDLLQYTNSNIIAHHVYVYKDPDYDPNNNLYLAEYHGHQAVLNMYPKLQQLYRPFELHCYQLAIAQDTEQFREIGLLPILDCIAHNATLYTGRCSNDQLIHENKPLSKLFLNRNNIAEMFGINIVEYNYYGCSKKQIRHQLGETLWNMTRSCVNPYQDGTPCHQCSKCEQTATAN